MIPISLRWRLPLSYAAIALLAALALGVVLLITLQNYYQQQELAYLTDNAQGLGTELARMIQSKAPAAALEAQLKNFSFLTQSRVRLLDGQNQPIADSGQPQLLNQVAAVSVKLEGELADQVSFFTQAITSTGSISADVFGYAPFIYLQDMDATLTPGSLITQTVIISGDNRQIEVFRWEGSSALTTPLTIAPATITSLIELSEITATDSFSFELSPGVISAAAPLPIPPNFFSLVPAIDTPYGLALNPATAVDGRRSDQLVTQPLKDSQGNLLGYIELSQGPAYGQEVVERVAWGWVAASGVAVAIAVGAGWLISRRLTTPLMALTQVTSRMAGGELSARAMLTRHDELGQLADSFNEMADRVEETVTTLRRFVADAAHELHTPLTALRTNLELASTTTGNSQAELVTRAQAEVIRLETLTRDLLDLSRLETGGVEAKLGALDLTVLMREVSEPYASQAEQAGLSFSLHLPDEAVIVAGNEAQLRRAVGNLLDNALKFSTEGGSVRVGLTGEAKSQEARPQVEVWVEDSGIGIPPGDLPHVFNRFHRGRNAAGYAGSGLGLAIVKTVVEGHGGQVSVVNLEQGTRFTFRLARIVA